MPHYVQMRVRRDRLHAMGAPVVIEAQALLKDTDTGRLLAQASYRNVSAKRIDSLVVDVTPVMADGTTGKAGAHTYQGTRALPDATFGQDGAEALPPSSLAFEVVPQVAEFADGTSWHADGAPWEVLPVARPLADAVTDADALQEFRLRLGTAGTRAAVAPYVAGDLWQCCCGRLNALTSDRCLSCGAGRDDVMLALSPDKLEAQVPVWQAEREERETTAALGRADALVRQDTVDSLSQAIGIYQGLTDRDGVPELLADAQARLAEAQKRDAEAKEHRKVVTRRAFVGAGIAAVAAAGVAVYVNVIRPRQQLRSLGLDAEASYVALDDNWTHLDMLTVSGGSVMLTTYLIGTNGAEEDSEQPCTVEAGGSGLAITCQDGSTVDVPEGGILTSDQMREALQGYWHARRTTDDWYAQIEGDTITVVAHVRVGGGYLGPYSSSFTLDAGSLVADDLPDDYQLGSWGFAFFERGGKPTPMLVHSGRVCSTSDGPLPAEDDLTNA